MHSFLFTQYTASNTKTFAIILLILKFLQVNWKVDFDLYLYYDEQQLRIAAPRQDHLLLAWEPQLEKE